MIRQNGQQQKDERTKQNKATQLTLRCVRSWKIHCQLYTRSKTKELGMRNAYTHVEREKVERFFIIMDRYIDQKRNGKRSGCEE